MKKCVFLIIFFTAAISYASPDVRDGDIIFQTSLSSQSLAIQRATNSPYSHTGIILFRGNKPYVFEASSTVRYTPLEKWIKQGLGGRYVIKRLKNSSDILSASAVQKLKKTAKKFEGKPYDPAFGWSDEKIYCSELVWKLYEQALGIRIGDLQKIRDFNISDSVVKAKLAERYGKAVPLDETVISPSSVFASDRLVTVAEK